MSYTVGDIRRWDVSALIVAGHEVGRRGSVAEDARRNLSDGSEALDEGWDGLAANAVLEAAEGEKQCVTQLSDGLEDLAGALDRAAAALGPAVQSVKDRIAEAEAAGLVVTDVAVESGAGGVGAGEGPDQALVDLHAEVISTAIETVRSLDEHYGREIDGIAARIHDAIPPEVDRSQIPGPDDPWPGRAVDAMTGGAQAALPRSADDLDPATRGAHAKVSLPDDHARLEAGRLRTLGKFAGPLGHASTVIGGVKDFAEGKVTAEEAVIETGGALSGGVAGGAVAGAAVGSFFGPVGTFIGAGVGAAAGAELGKNAGDWVHDRFFRDNDNDNEE